MCGVHIHTQGKSYSKEEQGLKMITITNRRYFFFIS